jgi:hypothetical protein
VFPAKAPPSVVPPSNQGNSENTAVISFCEELTEQRSSETMAPNPSAISAPQRLHTGQGLMLQHERDFCAIALQPLM